jgi:hypothetical protein
MGFVFPLKDLAARIYPTKPAFYFSAGQRNPPEGSILHDCRQGECMTLIFAILLTFEQYLNLRMK